MMNFMSGPKTKGINSMILVENGCYLQIMLSEDAAFDVVG